MRPVPPDVSGSAEVSGPPTHTRTRAHSHHSRCCQRSSEDSARTCFFFRSNSSVMGGQGLGGRRQTFFKLHHIQIMMCLASVLLLCGNITMAILLVINGLGSVVSCIFKPAETICLQRVKKPPAVETEDKSQKTDNQ